MPIINKLDDLDRREFLLGAAAASAITALIPITTALAQDAKAPPSWQEALKSIAGDAKPLEGKVNLDMPEIAENGNTVPFTILVDSPMTDKDHVKAVHILATGNPVPQVASFSFTPTGGKAMVASRMRLGRTQDVLAVAEMSDGKFYLGKRSVKVTIGGCGG